MKKITLSDEAISSLCMALSHLLHAGISVGDALVLLCQEEKDPVCRKLLQSLAELADQGVSLAEAFRRAECFPAYVCTLLTVGQQVGKTEETLASLSRYYTRRQQINRQLRQVLLYPMLLLGILLAVTVILLVWVLPVFNDVYAQLGSRLTGVAGGLLGFGQMLGRLLPFLCVLLALGLGIVAIAPVRKKLLRRLRSGSDRGISRKRNSARFVQALAMAVSSGMTDGEALALAATLSEEQGHAFQRRCAECLAAVEKDSTLAQALGDGDFLTPSQCRLLEAGTRSGGRETVLTALSQELDGEYQDRLYRAVGRVEPALVAVGCVLIGTVLLSVMLPLMHIMNAMG